MSAKQKFCHALQHLYDLDQDTLYMTVYLMAQKSTLLFRQAHGQPLDDDEGIAADVVDFIDLMVNEAVAEIRDNGVIMPMPMDHRGGAA
jgi:hypothetical protein